nr:RHS repeat-associated core domain-containing protein [Lysobacter niabensis]
MKAVVAFLLLASTGWAQAQTVEYIHTDALGSPVAVTDANRVVLERSEYEPYGKVLTPASPQDGPGYTGHVLDAVTGMNYMQQRYYDPQIGRFLSVDPVTADGNTGGNFNRYWYANSNPYKFSDPDGRQSMEAFEEIESEEEESFARGSFRSDLRTINPPLRPTSPYCQGAQEPNLEEEVRETINPTARGRQSELRILLRLQQVKNNKPAETSHGRVIADFENDDEVGEIKDTKRVSNTRQVRGERELAQRSGRQHVIHTGTHTRVSRTVSVNSRIVHHDDLGPRKK